MKPVLTSRVRTVLLAAIAALCLLTFGALPHSAASGPVANSGSAGAAQVQLTDHHNSAVLARSQAPAGVAELAAHPAVDLGSSAVALAITGLLLALLRRGRRTAVRYRSGPAPARAPPLAA